MFRFTHPRGGEGELPSPIYGENENFCDMTCVSEGMAVCEIADAERLKAKKKKQEPNGSLQQENGQT